MYEFKILFIGCNWQFKNHRKTVTKNDNTFHVLNREKFKYFLTFAFANTLMRVIIVQSKLTIRTSYVIAEKYN